MTKKSISSLHRASPSASDLGWPLGSLSSHPDLSPDPVYLVSGLQTPGTAPPLSISLLPALMGGGGVSFSLSCQCYPGLSASLHWFASSQWAGTCYSLRTKVLVPKTWHAGGASPMVVRIHEAVSPSSLSGPGMNEYCLSFPPPPFPKWERDLSPK